MSFYWSHALWLLLLPLGLWLAELTRRVRTAASRHPKIVRAEASPMGLSLRPEHTTTAAMPRVRWRLWLGLALVVTALARPQWGEIEEQVFEQSREILIGVDLSKSMLAPDVNPTRLDRAKLLITGLLDHLSGERVGLAVFSGTSFLQSPLSSDYEILSEFLPALSPEFLPEGGTEYAALLDTALDAFSNDTNADRYLIILSDGESQSESWRSRLEALRERGIRVISLGLGTTEGSMLPDGVGGFIKDGRGAVVLSRLNSATLEELARTTSGLYRDASAWVDLAELVQQTVESGQAGNFADTRQARRIERFQWALGPALLLLCWSLWREFPVRPRQRAVTIRPATPARAATLALLLGLLQHTSTSPARANEPPPSPEAPVTTLVAELAGQPDIAAADYAQLAERTLAWGQQLLSSGQPVTATVVYDALAGVDLGEAAAPDAADWPALREALLQLLQQSEQQQQQQDGDGEDQENQDQQQSQDQQGEGEGDDQQQQSGEDGEPSEQQGGEGDESESSENSQSQESEDEGDEQEQQKSSEGETEQQDPSEQQRQNAEQAFDRDDLPPEQEQPSPSEAEQQQPQPPPSGDQQSIGGQQVQNTSEAQNPELVVPLQKLDQIKDGDSPARLFQLMQDPAEQPPPPGRDW